MSDLISRQALKEKLHFLFEWYGKLPCSEEDKCIQRTIKRCMGEMDNAPTVDAVEVVRCEKCKHYTNYENYTYKKLGFWWCNKFGNITKLDDFCSYGERKEATE